MISNLAQRLAGIGLFLALATVATATTTTSGTTSGTTSDTSAIRQGAPYLLNVCVVSGRPLPADGGVAIILEGPADGMQTGREIRVCCKTCEGRFLKDPAKYVPKVDELIIADQMPRYPKTMPCLVMDAKSLPDPTGPKAKDCTLIVYKNRLVRLCCTRCNRKFESDPAKYIAMLDAAAIKEQKVGYPLTTCVVSGGNLRSSGPWFMIGDRAVTTCCGGCKGRAMKSPRAAVAKLDAVEKPEAKKTDA
jgi:YHS domain-containing protein